MANVFYGFAIAVMTAMMVVIFGVSIQVQKAVQLLQEIKIILEDKSK
jgi:hypothetical protein